MRSRGLLPDISHIEHFLEQKKAFAEEKNSIPNMAAVKSCENTLYPKGMALAPFWSEKGC